MHPDQLLLPGGGVRIAKLNRSDFSKNNFIFLEKYYLLPTMEPDIEVSVRVPCAIDSACLRYR